eukprot:991645-Lingulodinium_polyedra.AAC.1
MPTAMRAWGATPLWAGASEPVPADGPVALAQRRRRSRRGAGRPAGPSGCRGRRASVAAGVT